MASKARDLSNFISVATIDASEIASGAITTDKIADVAVTHAKLHTDMNLSGKSLTFAADQISGNAIDGGVISNFTSTGIDDNATSTAVTILSNGNVGIGTSSPTHALTVKSSGVLGKFEAVDQAAELRIESPTVDVIGLYTGTNDALTFGTASTERMRIDSSGNVGIGTAPSVTLHVKSPNPVFGLETTGTVSAGGTVYSELKDSTGTVFTSGFAGLANCYQFSTSAAAGFMRFLTGAGAERLRIDSSGNVGIGEILPQTKLHVKSGDSGGTVYDAGYNPLVIEGSSHTGLQILSPNNRNGLIYFGDNDNAVSGRIEYEHTNDAMLFVTAGTERMRIDSVGRVTKPYQPVASFSVEEGQISYATNQDVFAGKTTLVRALQGITYTSATGRFTVPVGGKYYIHFFSMKNGTITAYFNVHINGGQTAGLRIYDQSQATGWSPYGLGGIVTLAANDWINVICADGYANNAHGMNHMNFTAYLIG
jgi:hypothetical protein